MNSQKENTRSCCMCGSSPSKDPSITLHRFPKPGARNALRCELWTKYCFPNEAWHSPEFQNRLHSEHKMLCSKHFLSTCFIGNKLFRTAVPGDLAKDTTIPNLQHQLAVFEPIAGPSRISKTSAKNGNPTNRDSCEESVTQELGADEELDSDSRSADDDIVPPSEPHTLHLHTARICRVCLALDVKMFPLRDSELTIMFHTITGIQLEDNEGGNVGSLICWECAARLRAASTFRSKALLSDTLLQRLINKGEEIELEYFETVKEKADCLVPPKTLSATEITHVHIDQNETSKLVQSDDDDQHSVLDNIETQESIMDANIQMCVEGDDNVAMITEIEGTPIDKNHQKLPDLSDPFQSLTRSQEDCYDEMITNFLESIKKSRLKITRKRRKGAVLNDPSYCLKENSEDEIKKKVFKTYGGSSKKFLSKKS